MGIVIAVDAMGGDTAPLSVVEGVRAAVASSDLSVLLIGDEAVLAPLVGDDPRITIRHAPHVVPQDAEPVGAVVGYLLLRPYLTDTWLGILFAAVAGVMVFISLDELLPAAREYGRPHLAIYGMIGGMGVMAGSLVLFQI